MPSATFLGGHYLPTQESASVLRGQTTPVQPRLGIPAGLYHSVFDEVHRGFKGITRPGVVFHHGCVARVRGVLFVDHCCHSQH